MKSDYTDKILTLKEYAWYKIPADRPDRMEFIEAIKLRIDSHNDFMFNIDYSSFCRIKPFNKSDYSRGEITYSIEWRDINEVQFDYRHLPDPTFKKYTKAEWDKLSGRSI